jgi:ribonucleotide monophosphatase NagD (HAD superfamily)
MDPEDEDQMLQELTDPSKIYNIPRSEKVFFQYMKKNMKESPVLSTAEERIGEALEKQRQQKILQRIEFEK